MHARLGINNCFAVKRWPRPDDWASIVRNDLGLVLVENLVTDREPSTMALVENILAERSSVRAPIQLCLDLGHPFVCGGSPQDRDPYA